MRTRLVIPFALALTSPAFAHLVYTDAPELITIADGDPRDASILKEYCRTNGIGDNCEKEIGNYTKASAILTCAKKYSSSSWLKTMDHNKDQEELAHKASIDDPKGKGKRGTLVWHSKMIANPDSGIVHSHDYSEGLRVRALSEFRAKLFSEARKSGDDKSGASTIKGSTTNSVSTEVNAATPILKVGSLQLSTVGSQEVTKEVSPLSESQSRLIEVEAHRAYMDPSILGYEPDVVCLQTEEYCDSAGPRIKNTQYKPAAAKEEKTESKKSESSSSSSGSSSKKTSSNSGNSSRTADPSTAEGKVHDNPSDFADNDRHTKEAGNGEMWATPIDPDAIGGGHDLTGCINQELNRMAEEKGRREENQDLGDKETMIDKLKAGYCDPSEFGHRFCASWKAQQNIELPPDAQSRIEKGAAAMDAFLKGFGCDEEVLGEQFCRAMKDKLDVERGEPTVPAQKLDKKGQKPNIHTNDPSIPVEAPKKDSKLFPGKPVKKEDIPFTRPGQPTPVPTR